MSRPGAPGASQSKHFRGEPRETVITDLSHDGRGVCKLDGKVYFVSDVLPGERALVQPLRRRRGQDEALLLEVLAPSPHRTQPRCEYFGLCGGCALQHLDRDGQLQLKEARLLSALARIGGLTPRRMLAPVTGEAWSYRRRARLGVRWVRARERVMVGFRERGGSFIADMGHCEILAGKCRDLPARLSALIGSLSIRRRVPQVEIAAADNAVALVFRVLDPPEAADLAALTAFGDTTGFRVYLQPGGPDTLQQLTGDSAPLCYRLADWDLTLSFGAVDFIQVNATVNERMIGAALEALAPEPGDSVLDLFCGLGNFSLPAARLAGRVTGIEGESALVARARSNAAANGVDNAEFHTANLFNDIGDFPWARSRYDKVLLDPPRAGASAMTGRLAAMAPARIVYVSCHPATLARDAAALHAAGYTLAAAGILDMFPQTAHVESMAVFERG